jgi:hypothetical protein
MCGGGSLALRRRPAPPRLLLCLWVTAMPEGEGSQFDYLDAAFQSGSSKKRLAMLRRVTDLFLSEADRLNEEQISVFDNGLVQLIERIETRTLVEISEHLAPVANGKLSAAFSRLSCRPDLPRRRNMTSPSVISRNYRNPTLSDCFDFVRSAR